jgi:hypothetical protein
VCPRLPRRSPRTGSRALAEARRRHARGGAATAAPRNIPTRLPQPVGRWPSLALCGTRDLRFSSSQRPPSWAFSIRAALALSSAIPRSLAQARHPGARRAGDCSFSHRHAPRDRVGDLALIGVGNPRRVVSMTHAMGLQNRANFQSRLRLAATMIRLSRRHAIAPQRDLLAAELDRALKARFGLPTVPRRAQVFGVGANHLHGRAIVDYEPPAELALTSGAASTR